MKKLLIIIDMQNDFVTGPLGTPEAQAIVPNIKAKIDEYKENGWDVIFTQDTHDPHTYMGSLEGEKLPTPHCMCDTEGWKIVPELETGNENCLHYQKDTFGLDHWPLLIDNWVYTSFELVGVCTGICVLSNAVALRMFFPDMPITVDASCCACVTPESHKTALAAMKMCQIDVINE